MYDVQRLQAGGTKFCDCIEDHRDNFQMIKMFECRFVLGQGQLEGD